MYQYFVVDVDIILLNKNASNKKIISLTGRRREKAVQLACDRNGREKEGSEGSKHGNYCTPCCLISRCTTD
jgi:hypothetical protein